MSTLGEILSSKVREKVFQHLFDGQDRELYMRELERRSGCAIGTIQTELKKLSRLDLVNNRRDGNRLYYRANQEHPLYADICSMVSKTVGIIGLLRAAIAERQDIDCAFVLGSVAQARELAHSDVDLLVIGNIDLRTLVGVLVGVADVVHRQINPHVMSPQELRERVESHDHFVTNVMKSTKIFIRGGDNDLGKLAGQWVAEGT